jgi:hypothetical protein
MNFTQETLKDYLLKKFGYSEEDILSLDGVNAPAKNWAISAYNTYKRNMINENDLCLEIIENTFRELLPVVSVIKTKNLSLKDKLGSKCNKYKAAKKIAIICGISLGEKK